MTPISSDLFDLSQTDHVTLFDGVQYPWDVLKRLAAYIATTLRPVQLHRTVGRTHIGTDVQLGEGTVVEEGAMILGPAIIGRGCQIRHNAYLRENVIVGDNCVVGNSCELKHSVLFNGAQVPHFNYVGDSVLGYRAHLGAGVILSNVKLDRRNIFVDVDGTPVDTGLRKFGALVGDDAEVGCNSVINPGSILGRGSLVYPNVSWRGILPRHMVVKNQAPIEVVHRRPRTTG
jgi:acetyltransferase-like isoleucine patch superfamily enzyme